MTSKTFHQFPAVQKAWRQLYNSGDFQTLEVYKRITPLVGDRKKISYFIKATPKINLNTTEESNNFNQYPF